MKIISNKTSKNNKINYLNLQSRINPIIINIPRASQAKINNSKIIEDNRNFS